MKIGLLLISLAVINAKGQAQKSAREPIMFHGGVTHKGCYAGNGYQKMDKVKWAFTTKGKVFSSPCVTQGVVLIGSEDGNLYAIGERTGKLNWKFSTGGAVHSSAAVYGNTVYFGSFDGYYYAVDIHNGKLQWKFKTGGEKKMGGKGYLGFKPENTYTEDLWDFWLSSPVVYEHQKGVVVCFGSSDGNVYALRAESGALLWKFPTGGMVRSTPAVSNHTVYVGSWDAYLYALDAATGQEKWKFETGRNTGFTGILASPIVEDNKVYFGARDGYFYALQAQTGALLWKHSTDNSWILSTASIKGGIVYTGTSDTNLMLGLDAEDGRERFRLNGTGYMYSSPAISGETLFFGDFTGRMYSADLTSTGGRYNYFTTETRKKNAAGILKSDTLNFLFAAKGADLNQYAVNEKVMNDFYSLGSIVSSPVVKDKVVYFGSADNKVYAVEVKKQERKR